MCCGHGRCVLDTLDSCGHGRVMCFGHAGPLFDSWSAVGTRVQLHGDSVYLMEYVWECLI